MLNTYNIFINQCFYLKNIKNIGNKKICISYGEETGFTSWIQYNNVVFPKDFSIFNSISN